MGILEKLSLKHERERRRNAKRYAEKPWRKWYNTAAWRARRALQLAAEPRCERCLAEGRVTPATVANHRIPHRGDWNRFAGGALESLCKQCHDKAAQETELKGFHTAIDVEGWPSDPNHPVNQG